MIVIIFHNLYLNRLFYLIKGKKSKCYIGDSDQHCYICDVSTKYILKASALNNYGEFFMIIFNFLLLYFSQTLLLINFFYIFYNLRNFRKVIVFVEDVCLSVCAL